MATGTREAGEFCWINMLSPRPTEAMEFFGRILGWTYFEMPGLGHGIRVDGCDIGGLFDLDGPNTPPGLEPMIGVMVKVDSAAAAAGRVAALGGAAKPAFDIAEQGRMAVCHDPDGAEFDVWEPKRMSGTDVDSRRHGAPGWFECLTADVERATAFYAGVFGWTSVPMPMPMPGSTYTVFRNEGTDVAGLMRIPPRTPDARPRWTTYFTVADADEAAREAVELGARIDLALRDVPGVGRLCGIRSPQGVAFHVIRWIR